MAAILQDFRYSVRTLRKSPVFLAVAVLSLALGIGANTAIFTLINQLILQPLPVRNPEQLVMLAGRGKLTAAITGPIGFHTRCIGKSATRTRSSAACSALTQAP